MRGLLSVLNDSGPNHSGPNLSVPIFSLRNLSLKMCLASVLLVIGTLAIPYNSVASAEREELAGDLKTIIRTGQDFERNRSWAKAIEIYEQGLEKWTHTELEYGLRRSKIHFAIERRYDDSSFRQSLGEMSRENAIDVLEEVMGKVRANYVDNISETSFLAHGTESLYLALSNKRFLEENLSDIQPVRIQTLRKALREHYWNRPVNDHEDGIEMVREVCALTLDEIGLSASSTVMEYIFGGCNALDDYSCYLSPGKLKDLYNNIDGQFVGLGIEMKTEPDKGLLLMNVLPGSPAHEGGLLAGERIVEVSGQSCLNLSTDAAAALLQGREGSRVALKVAGRNDDIREVTVTRRAVDVKSVPIAKIIDTENGIGYIQLTGFQKTTPAEMDAALARLQGQGMRSLIWDVRGNPGGLLTAAVEVLDRFIDEGVLVSTRGRIPDQNYSYSAHRTGTLHMPLVLLTDGDSASASEIVAGAIRDHKRGTILGRKTYGKWSVQTIHDLANAQSGLRLTTAKFYSPHGHTLGKIGVKPDFELKAPSPTRQFFLPPTELNLAEDTDVQKGMELLQGTLARNNDVNRSELVRDVSR